MAEETSSAPPAVPRASWEKKELAYRHGMSVRAIDNEIAAGNLKVFRTRGGHVRITVEAEREWVELGSQRQPKAKRKPRLEALGEHIYQIEEQPPGEIPADVLAALGAPVGPEAA